MIDNPYKGFPSARITLVKRKQNKILKSGTVMYTRSEDFIDNVVSGSCALAKHRRSQTLDVQDVKLYLNQQWNLQIPGFPVDDSKH